MIRSLLVAYDGSHGARVALQHAVDLARCCDGRVVLLTVGKTAPDDASLLGGREPDPVALAAPVPENTDEPAAGAEADAVLSEAVELCRELTVRCLARPAYGDLPAAIARASRFSDLVFIGRDALAEPGSGGRSARSARRVAMVARCPVVVTPRQYQPTRSVLAACPAEAARACTVRVAGELAWLLKVKLEALLVAAEQDVAGPSARDLKRYLVDHGHSADVIVRKPPARDALVASVGDRQSPLVVVPRSSRWDTLLHRDWLSAALEIVNATIVVVP
ncbi:MAG: universal stress protein [Armatimonadetes bacterium]|nr:universal stress protein [Armatimonadota bacterium]